MMLRAQGWEKVYGSANYESGYNISRTADGGFLVGGPQQESSDTTTENFWVARFNAAGTLLWDSSYGKRRVAETMFAFTGFPDGSGMIGGFTGAQFSGVETAEMFRFDSLGRTMWTKEIDYPKSDHFHLLLKRPEGGYYFAGHTDSKGDPRGDMWLVRLDDNRDSVWERTYDLGGGEHAHHGFETPDGGMLLFGHANVNAHEKWWVLKTDSMGVKQWDTVLSSSATYNDSPYHAFLTREGNYAFVGGSSHQSQAIGTSWLVVMSPSRKILVNKHYGDPAKDQFTWSGSQTSDGGYIVAGYVAVTSRNVDMFIAKSDSLGNEEWIKTFGAEGEEFGFDVVELEDGYVACGYTGSGSLMTGGGGDLYLVKIPKPLKPLPPLAPDLLSPRNDSVGVHRSARFTWSAPATATMYHVQIASDSLFANIVLDAESLLVTGAQHDFAAIGRYWWRVQATNTVGNGPWSDVWSFEITTLAAVDPLVVASAARILDVIPNPFTHLAQVHFNLAGPSRVSMVVRDLLGRTVITTDGVAFGAGQGSLTLDGSGLPSGTYLVEMISEGSGGTTKSDVRRIVIDR